MIDLRRVTTEDLIAEIDKRKKPELDKAIEMAKKGSLDGCVQHVCKTAIGTYYVSDWFDSDSTIKSFVSGEET